VELVENKIRAHIFAKRIRLNDLFADFDRLKTGYVTSSQFRRCVGAAMDRGVVSSLAEAEYQAIMEHYQGKNEYAGRVNWSAFVDSIDKGLA
jgi:Ca2+-binding EF-hand superfamily protein